MLYIKQKIATNVAIFFTIFSVFVVAINEIDFLPKVIKFTDDGLLLITDGDKQYDYFL